MPIYEKLILDEMIRNTIPEHFLKYAEANQIQWKDVLFVSESHPGIPDGHLLHHLCGPNDALLTEDRALHNTALSRGYSCYFTKNQEVNPKPLPGIHVKHAAGFDNIKAPLKTNYIRHNASTPFLRPTSETQLKKLRTKRRRIRNHFEGLEHIRSVGTAVSIIPKKRKVLIGIRIRVIANTHHPAILGSESYIIEKMDKERQGRVAIVHALKLLVLLHLNHVPNTIYYDTNMDSPYLHDEDCVHNLSRLLYAVKSDFKDLKYEVVKKGRHLNELRLKLIHLNNNPNTNEIIKGDYERMVKDFLEWEQAEIALDEDAIPF